MAGLGGLGEYIARTGPTGPTGAAGGGVELVTGTVLTWTAGSRTVDVFGVSQTVRYDSALAGTLVAGDVVAILRTGGDHLVLCKVADA